MRRLEVRPPSLAFCEELRIDVWVRLRSHLPRLGEGGRCSLTPDEAEDRLAQRSSEMSVRRLEVRIVRHA